MEALSVHAESLLTRDASKRKRVNRNAKIKQYKLDARREQWLSQGKQTISVSGTSMVAMQKELMLPEHQHQQQMGGDNSDAESCVINQDEPPVDGMWCISNAVSKFISCSHHARGGKPDLVQAPAPAKSKARRRRSKKVAPEEEIHGGDEDWEAAADALDCQMNLSDGENAGKGDEFDHHQPVAGKSNPMSISVPARPPSLAWTPNDASRPASLPKVVMFRSPAAVEEAAESGPLCCLICTEELDCTESSFIPCSCGFRLCLFCHHRISAEDGRCPGCRMLYRA